MPGATATLVIDDQTLCQGEAVGQPLHADERIERAVRRGIAHAVEARERVAGKRAADGAMGAEPLDVSVSCTAARPACWMNGATPECVTSTSSVIASRAPSGTTSQPRRQPVITQVLEKLLHTITRSSGSAMSSSDGAADAPS